MAPHGGRLRFRVAVTLDPQCCREEVKSAGNFKAICKMRFWFGTACLLPGQVCVCGGAGGIGQPLSMLMALDPNVKDEPSGFRGA